MKRILLIGATGAVGRAAAAALAHHEIIRVGRSSGEIRADLANGASLRAMYEAAGIVDAVVCCAGSATFVPLGEMNETQFMKGLQAKLMGQINLVLLGLAHLRDGGSFTLTSGSLDRYPVRRGTNAATINAGLSGFVRAAALDLPRGIRINVVSPTVLEASAAKFAPLLPGHEPVAAARVGLAYVKSVDGAMTGETICVG